MPDEVTFLNPQTCGIYKSGGVRYKTNPETGLRTDEIDNQLAEAVEAFVRGETSPGESVVPADRVIEQRVLVPTYYDQRYNEGIRALAEEQGIEMISIGKLLAAEIIAVRGGHGSPGNDQRSGHIPYVKVSDIRGLRVNVNPTNLVRESVARRLWRGDSSGLEAWDVITPNRASSNIGEFAIILPGEERIVVTKEVFVFRVVEDDGPWDPFYLLWCLCLRAVRDQWRRIALMQTNREDCGERYREIRLPNPPSTVWARERSDVFRNYFTTSAEAKQRFATGIADDQFDYIACVASLTTDDEGTADRDED